MGITHFLRTFATQIRMRVRTIRARDGVTSDWRLGERIAGERAASSSTDTRTDRLTLVEQGQV